MLTITHPALARICGSPDFDRAAYGYAPAGASDRSSAAWANAALGNDLSTNILEISLGANTLHFDQACTIAWAGAPHRVSKNGDTLPARQAIAVGAGETVTITPGVWGNRVAIATVGGWQFRYRQYQHRHRPACIFWRSGPLG